MRIAQWASVGIILGMRTASPLRAVCIHLRLQVERKLDPRFLESSFFHYEAQMSTPAYSKLLQASSGALQHYPLAPNSQMKFTE